MVNARSRFALTALLSFSVSLCGQSAFAWSALQYDTKYDTSLEKPTRTFYDEIMEKTKKQVEAEEAAGTQQGSADEPLPVDASAEKRAGRAQSAIEQDAVGEPEMNQGAQKPPAETEAQADKDSEETKPAKPRTAGKMPTESITDPDYFYRKAKSFVEERDYQSALNYINKSLALNPEFWEAAYEKGLIYQLAGYDAAAARRYISLLERKPDLLAARIALGMLYRKHGNRSLAEGEYEKAIEANFRYFPAHYNLANLYMDEGKYEQALKEYKLCLKLKPDNAHVHNNLGVIYQHRNYLEEAVAEFTKATHLDPASQPFADNLANARAKLTHKSSKEVSM